MSTYFCLAIFFFDIFSLAAASAKLSEDFIIIDGASSFVVFQMGEDVQYPTTPACSFNIPLSLMGYERGFLQDMHIPCWDYREGYDAFSPSWRAKQDPMSWMQTSCVWYAKILSQYLGAELIKHYLDQFAYGNCDTTGGVASPGSVNPFWISSTLKISPEQQVHFLQKMLRGCLGIHPKAVQACKLLLFKEHMPSGAKLFGKTGLGTDVDGQGKKQKVRWLVGWIEAQGNVYPFAYRLIAEEIDLEATILRVKDILSAISLS